MTDSLTPDHQALAPVVGILLLLSLTVLLGATAATFAMGLADEPTESPNAAFSFEADRGAETVSIKHHSGDAIEADNLYVVVEGVTCSGSDNPDGRYNVDDDFQMGPDKMASGMTVQYGQDIDLDGNEEICKGEDISIEGATFKIVWQPPSGNSVELQSWTA